jgi:hypothetical protein
VSAIAAVEIRHARSEAIKLDKLDKPNKPDKPDKLDKPEVREEELCVLEKR